MAGLFVSPRGQIYIIAFIIIIIIILFFLP